MASPQVCGAAALVKSANPALNAREIKAALLCATEDITATNPGGNRNSFGMGYLRDDLACNTARTAGAVFSGAISSTTTPSFHNFTATASQGMSVALVFHRHNLTTTTWSDLNLTIRQPSGAVVATSNAPRNLSEVARFIAPVSGTGFLVGRRARSGSLPLHRRFSNAFTTWMVSRLAGRPVFDAQSGFRAYRAELADCLPREGRFEWESQALVICSRRGYGVEAVPVRTLYRGAGSHMRLGRDTWRFLRMVGRLAWTR
jgi:hypothetical protein